MWKMSDSEEEIVEKQLKIAFVGESSVGKVRTKKKLNLWQTYFIYSTILQTSIIRRFCHDDEFSRQYNQTVGADFYIKRINFPGKQNITLKITDIGGQELRGSMLDKYLFNCNVCKNIFFKLFFGLTFQISLFLRNINNDHFCFSVNNPSIRHYEFQQFRFYDTLGQRNTQNSGKSTHNRSYCEQM